MTTPPLDSLLRGLSSEQSAKAAFLVTPTRTVTYGELHDGIARTRGLFRRLGLNPGDRLAIATQDDLSLAQLYGACLLSGVVAVVLDPHASAAEITVLVTKGRVGAIIADAAVVERASAVQHTEANVVAIATPGPAKSGFGLLRRIPKPEANDTNYPGLLRNEEPVDDRVEFAPESPALILFTSGTTSQPKGVVLTRRNLAAQMATLGHHFGFNATSRVANPLPTHHTDGLNQGPLLAMTYGSVWIRPGEVSMQSLGDVLDRVQQDRATHFVTVPTVISMMLRLPEAWDDAFSYDGFEFVASSAGYLDEEIWRRVEDRFDTMVVNAYGLTETVMDAIYCGPTEATRRHGTIGKPIDCEAKVVDDEGNDLDVGSVGELLIRGDNVMSGYFEDAEATAAVLTDDGWLHTGDLARFDEDGFCTIAGRKKNVIIRGGVSVYPEDVNSALLGAPSVTAVATVGIPDPALGERVVACVAAEGDPDTVMAAALEHCRRELAAEKVPNQVVVLDALPLGPSGKVELAKVTQIVSEAVAGPVEGETIADQVLNVAARVFGESADQLSPASTPDSTAGWDSLSFLELIMSLERQFDMVIPPRDVMTMASLGDAVLVVENR